MMKRLACEVSVENIFRKYKHILLLLDYDGTLTPIVRRPQDALLDKKTKKALKTLAGKKVFTVGIISGRKLSDIRGLVGIKGIYYAGNHGLEISGPEISFKHPLYKRSRPYIREIGERLAKKLKNIDGAFIEDKDATLSLHYRLVKKGAPLRELKKIFRAICRPYIKARRIRVTAGKKVFEVRPFIKWDKGDAVRTIRNLVKSAAGTLTIFMGDDRTDEDAFAVLKKKDGLSIFVGGRRKSKAKYFLKDTKEAGRFLERLAKIK